MQTFPPSQSRSCRHAWSSAAPLQEDRTLHAITMSAVKTHAVSLFRIVGPPFGAGNCGHDTSFGVAFETKNG
jgi:hypothetical protein